MKSTILTFRNTGGEKKRYVFKGKMITRWLICGKCRCEDWTAEGSRDHTFKIRGRFVASENNIVSSFVHSAPVENIKQPQT